MAIHGMLKASLPQLLWNISNLEYQAQIEAKPLKGDFALTPLMTQNASVATRPS